MPDKAAIKCLRWLVAGARIDTPYTKQTCARYSINSGPVQWDAVLRIIRSLKGTTGYGIVYRRSLRNSLNIDDTVITETWSIEDNLVNHPNFKLLTLSRGVRL